MLPCKRCFLIGKSPFFVASPPEKLPLLAAGGYIKIFWGNSTEHGIVFRTNHDLVLKFLIGKSPFSVASPPRIRRIVKK